MSTSRVISGVRSVDFIIRARGEGVVNHNGSFPVYSPTAGKRVDNHLFPKLKGFDPLQRVGKAGDQSSLVPRLDDERLSKASLMVSSACIRSGLFRDVSFGMKSVTVDNAERVLASLHGLVRGYLITEGNRSMARKSPLHVTDFEAKNPGLTFSQGSNQNKQGTSEESSSLYSFFTTDSDLRYVGKASLSMEDLQFIPLDNRFNRSCLDFTTTVAAGERLAARITEFLGDLAAGQDRPADRAEPRAEFVRKAVRVAGIVDDGEAGILLDDAALEVIASETCRMIEGLSIRQGKGWLSVHDVLVDYNPERLFRIIDDRDVAAESLGEASFARYYEPRDMETGAFETEQAKIDQEQKERKAASESRSGSRGKKKAAKRASV